MKAIYVRQEDGRAYVKLRDGRQQTYARCVVEAHLERHLLPAEVVHHINGDNTDDRVENLAVLSSQSDHLALHRHKMIASREAKRTHCKRGHEFAGDNIWLDSRGWRHCRECMRESTRRWRRRQKRQVPA